MKKQNWQGEFQKYIASVTDKKFERGKFDCVMFACNCLKIITGKDFARGFRGKYKNKKAAYELLKEIGFDDLEQLATDRLGEPLNSVFYAQRGDLVSVMGHEGVTLAIVDLSGRNAVYTGREGLVYEPMKYWLKAWRT